VNVGIDQAGQHEPARENLGASGWLVGETTVPYRQFGFFAFVEAHSAHDPVS
jgi:hypothetical protein